MSILMSFDTNLLRSLNQRFWGVVTWVHKTGEQMSKEKEQRFEF